MWTEDREAKLLETVGNDRPVSQETVANAAEVLEVSTRSISAKLRKMGVEVEPVSARAKVFSDEQEAQLVQFLNDNEGSYTYAEIAENFPGSFSAKQIQGKILSLELTGAVKPTPKKETVKVYSDAEEKKFVALAESGAFLEDIAEALGKTLASVRGKALSLNRMQGLSIPKQRDYVGAKEDPITALGDNIVNLTVAEIAEKVGKTERGVKTIITRRGLKCADYEAKARKEAA